MKFKESQYNLLIDTDDEGRKLLFNTAMGSVCWFTPEILEKFADISNISDKSIAHDLVRMGFVVPSGLDEYRKLLLLKNSTIYKTNPERVVYVIAPTTCCNLMCEYCFEKNEVSKTDMDERTWENTYEFIVNQIKERTNCKRVHIAWFGGEPTLKYPEMLVFSKKIRDYIAENGLVFSSSMVTNGLLLNRLLAENLNRHCALERVQVTIDGLARTYSRIKNGSESDFYSLVDNISDCSDIIKISVRINVNRENKDEILPLLQYLLDERNLCGKVEIYLAPIKDYLLVADGTYMNSKEFTEFRKSIMEVAIKSCWAESFPHNLPTRHITPCGGMSTSNCVIAPDGKLYRCEHCIGKHEWCIGDVEGGFYHNQEDACFVEAKLPEKCSVCKSFPLCAGGCVADRVIDNIEVSCDAYEESIIDDVKFAVAYKKLLTDSTSSGSIRS